MYSLNFGAFCSALEDIQPQTLWKPYLNDRIIEGRNNSIVQPDIVTAVMLLPYSDKDLDELDEEISEIPGPYANRCVRNKSKVKDEIRKYTRTVGLDKLQHNIESRIIHYLTKQQQAQLLEALKALVRQLPLNEDPTGLKVYLDLYYSDNGDNLRYGNFLAKCVQFCLLMPNTPGETAKLAWFNKGSIAGERDPYRLVSDDVGSTAISVSLFDIREFQEPKEYHCFDKLIQRIINQCLIIKNIDCSSGAIHVISDRFPKNGYILRRLEKTDADMAQQFIRCHEEEFRQKRSWDGVPLSTMAYEGLEAEIWTAYGYFSPDGKLISYLDAKLRIDGGVELGIALTDPQFRGMQLATSLIYFFRLLYAHWRLFGGTYEENRSMRRTFDTTGFTGIMYYDRKTDKITKKIAERIDLMYPEDKSKDTNSVYYFAESLMTLAFYAKTSAEKQSKEHKHENDC